MLLHMNLKGARSLKVSIISACVECSILDVLLFVVTFCFHLFSLLRYMYSIPKIINTVKLAIYYYY